MISTSESEEASGLPNPSLVGVPLGPLSPMVMFFIYLNLWEVFKNTEKTKLGLLEDEIETSYGVFEVYKYSSTLSEVNYFFVVFGHFEDFKVNSKD